jgi:hypothetical protein
MKYRKTRPFYSFVSNDECQANAGGTSGLQARQYLDAVESKVITMMAISGDLPPIVNR